MSAAEDGQTSGSYLDRPFLTTFFPNFAAQTKKVEELTLRSLAPRVRTETARSKDQLPWLKLAQFGDRKTPLVPRADGSGKMKGGCLRHDANVLQITGIEGDYDQERVSVDEAVDRLEKARVAAMVYTSPSHTEDTPRWRVLCPTSVALPPTERDRLLARLNGVLGGILAGESWTLSQSYYYGSINKNPSHHAQLIEGEPIDLRPDLDATAIVKPKPADASGRPASNGAYAPVSNKRYEAFCLTVLDTLRREATTEGQKHFALLRCATTLGGIQAAAGFSDHDAWEWIKAALPDTVRDWRLAERTAKDGLARGRDKPLQLEDRPKAKANGRDPAEKPSPAKPADDAAEQMPEGYWRPIDPNEVFDPGRRFQVNLTTGQNEVFESGPLPNRSNGSADGHDAPTSPDLRATVARLAGLDAVDLLKQCSDDAKALGIKPSTLKALVKSHQAEDGKRAKAAAAAEAARLRDQRLANQIWPDPFREENGKIFWERPRTDPNPFPLWVCDAFRLLAETTDAEGKDWGFLISWMDRDGTRHQQVFHRRQLHTRGCEIAELLEHHGLACNPSQEGHGMLRQLFSRLATAERKLCVTRSGWHHIRYGAVFVLPSGEVFGPGADTVILTSPPTTSTAQNGTLAEWKAAIGNPAANNTRMALTICSSLAAPLLEIVHETSRGLNLHGNSQIGKSTATSAGASVWGKGSTLDGYMRTWCTTANGFELIAREFHDLPTYLDEMTVADPREISQVIYLFSNETGKTRASRDGQSAIKVNTSRGILCSTSELTLTAKMAERDISPQAGQTVRLIEIPADAGKAHGAFEELPEGVTGAKFSTQLTAAARNTYGTAGRAWIERLVRDRAKYKDLRERIEARRMKWLKENPPRDEHGNAIKDVDGQVSTVAKFFSLLAAAGEMAIIAKILPWEPGTADKAAAAGLKAWINERGGTGAWENTKIIQQIRFFFSLHGESRFVPIQEVQDKQGYSNVDRAGDLIVRDRAGFRDENFFYVFPEVWKNQICKGLDQKRAAELLFNSLWLDRGEKGHLAKKETLPGFRQIRVYKVSIAILH